MIDIHNIENIIIFGAGEGHIFKWLIYKYKNKICLIVDNNQKKWGTYKSGILVESVDKIKNYSKENTVIVVSLYNYIDEIHKQVSELGWGENLIIAKEDMDELYSIEYFLFMQNMTTTDYAPQICNIELSGICNCKCIYCPFHGVQNIKKDQKGLMSWDTLRAVVEQLKEVPTLNKISTVGAGEIFVHPEWFEMTQYILKETKLQTLIMYTNGMLLHKENIKKLLQLDVDNLQLEISIDGRTEKDNDYYRTGSNYAVIKENIYHLLKEKEQMNKNIELLITNCYPVRKEELINTGHEYESQYAKVPKYLEEDFSNIKIISQNTYIYKRNDKEYNYGNLKMKEVSFPKKRYKCINLFNRIAINFRGDLLRCSCGHAGIEGIGNVRDCNIYDLWKNDIEINRAREHFIKGDIIEDMCEGCPSRGMGNYCIMIE